MQSLTLINQTINLARKTCSECGVEFAVPRTLEDKWLKEKNTGQGWFCPNGHNMVYSGESDASKAARLQIERDRALCDAEIFRKEVIAEKEKHEKLQKRISNGVCPKCKHSFQNLKRHMDCKHKAK